MIWKSTVLEMGWATPQFFRFGFEYCEVLEVHNHFIFLVLLLAKRREKKATPELKGKLSGTLGMAAVPAMLLW